MRVAVKVLVIGFFIVNAIWNPLIFSLPYTPGHLPSYVTKGLEVQACFVCPGDITPYTPNDYATITCRPFPDHKCHDWIVK